MNHVNLDEFQCKCGCGVIRTSPTLMNLCDKGREMTGIPWVVNSAYRCAEHNANVGSSSDVHVKGLAVDVGAKNSRDRFLVMQAMMQLGFRRIGVHKEFIHGDIDHDKPEELLWIY